MQIELNIIIKEVKFDAEWKETKTEKDRDSQTKKTFETRSS